MLKNKNIRNVGRNGIKKAGLVNKFIKEKITINKKFLNFSSFIKINLYENQKRSKENGSITIVVGLCQIEVEKKPL
jgi:hypothetical protein